MQISAATSAIDFRNGAVPRTVNMYVVPTGYVLVLDEIDVFTMSITNPGADPVITVGNTSDHAAYEPMHQKGTLAYMYLGFGAQMAQTAVAGTTITATVTTNSTATAHTGIIALNGYLVPATGIVPTPPSPPDPTDFFGVFYTVDPSGDVVANITIEYALTVPPAGNGLSYDANPHATTSDGSGLVEIPMQSGATYKLWSALNAPVLVTIPSDATSPYQLPNFVFNTPCC